MSRIRRGAVHPLIAAAAVFAVVFAAFGIYVFLHPAPPYKVRIVNLSRQPVDLYAAVGNAEEYYFSIASRGIRRKSPARAPALFGHLNPWATGEFRLFGGIAGSENYVYRVAALPEGTDIQRFRLSTDFAPGAISFKASEVSNEPGASVINVQVLPGMKVVRATSQAQ